MPITPIPIGDTQTIMVEVPCPYRAQCYLPMVEKILQQLQRSNYGDGHNPFLGNAINSQPLWQWLVEFLDQVVINFVDRDLKLPAHKHIISEKDTVSALEKYFKLHAGVRDDEYGKYLLDKYTSAGFSDLLKRLTKDFLDFIRSALTRVSIDEKFLIRGFCHGDETSHLERIIPSGSDLHKGGQQVLILEFITQDGKNYHVVYKPSSVLVDMMLMGDTHWLHDSDLQAHVFELAGCVDSGGVVGSVAERVNLHVEARSKLPTYRIFPCQYSDVAKSYGYLEYISHVPWHTKSLSSEILEQLEKEGPKADLNGIQLSIIEMREQVLLYKIFKDNESCNYVARDQKEYLDYSR